MITRANVRDDVHGLVLGAVLLGAKSGNDRPVPGRFDFDGYKERKLSQRGLFDKTK